MRPLSIPSPPPEWSSFTIGPFTIHAYAIIILCGIVAAVLWTNARLVRRGGEPWLVIDIALWAVLLGIAGARFYHVITHPADFFYPGADPLRVISIWEGGNAIMGALLGGAAGTWLVCRRAGIRFLGYADALAPALLLAQTIGRLGNYFNHELFGQPTTLPWGLEIEPSNPAWPPGLPEGTLFHPTFLYEMLWNLLGVAVILIAERKFSLRWGRGIAVYFIWYGLGRLWIENLRVDYSEIILGMRSNALAALLLVLLGVTLFVVQRVRHPEAEEPSIYLPGRSRPGDEQADSPAGQRDAAIAAGAVGAVSGTGDEEGGAARTEAEASEPVTESTPQTVSEEVDAEPAEPKGESLKSAQGALGDPEADPVPHEPRVTSGTRAAERAERDQPDGAPGQHEPREQHDSVQRDGGRESASAQPTGPDARGESAQPAEPAGQAELDELDGPGAPGEGDPDRSAELEELAGSGELAGSDERGESAEAAVPVEQVGSGELAGSDERGGESAEAVAPVEQVGSGERDDPGRSMSLSGPDARKETAQSAEPDEPAGSVSQDDPGGSVVLPASDARGAHDQLAEQTVPGAQDGSERPAEQAEPGQEGSGHPAEEVEQAESGTVTQAPRQGTKRRGLLGRFRGRAGRG